MVLINGILFFRYDEVPSEFTYVGSALSGYSVGVVLYIFTTSLRMCIWYKLNLFCLLLVQFCGLLYKYSSFIDLTQYMYVITLFSASGVLFFLIFKVLYKVTDLFLCTRRHLTAPR